ncbi:MAG: hypothetical protein NC206_07580 [Bacteroides sp.]|nr:hypothetical protein [Roseburia sp.]MCM1346931.1 hypothetical protein [Bacteroides sp.]MCM1421503.1 hypothetical protein [Bacteroides sp.]
MSIKENIFPLVERHDWDALRQAFSRMTNMEFRKTESVMRNDILTKLSNEDFWEALFHLVVYRHQAFITCILSIEHLVTNRTLSFDSPWIGKLVTFLKEKAPGALQKLMTMAIPMLETENQIDTMFKAFGFENERDRIAALISVANPLAYYVLFKILKHLADDRDLIRKCCVFILKRNDELSYNMASIIREYFDLADIRSRFSLVVAPYELSFIDNSYEKFKYVVTGKRPKI